MTEINFGSTYRIPITQQGINKAKKVQLKSLIDSYGGLVGTGNTGYARVSMPNSKDESFLRELKKIGYKIFQEFEGESIPKKNLDDYIKPLLDNREYKQYGKQKDRAITRKSKLKDFDYEQDIKKFVIEESEIKPVEQPTVKKTIEHVNRVDSAEQERIRNTESYKDIERRYGKEFAEAVFFLERKK